MSIACQKGMGLRIYVCSTTVAIFRVRRRILSTSAELQNQISRTILFGPRNFTAESPELCRTELPCRTAAEPWQNVLLGFCRYSARRLQTESRLAQTEFEASLTAAYDYEKCMPMPADWTDEGHQSLLDEGLQYTLTAAIWDGVYVTMEPEPDIAPLGDDDHTDQQEARQYESQGSENSRPSLLGRFREDKMPHCSVCMEHCFKGGTCGAVGKHEGL